MGLFEKIFGRYRAIGRADSYFKMLTGYAPVWHSWSGELYESERARAAIDARAKHIGKLSIEILGAARPTLQTQLRKAPNPWQTWYQFLYRLSTILDMQNTAFIVPVLDDMGRTMGIYAILPSACEVVDYAGEPWLRIKFSDGKTAAIELGKCGVMTKFQYADDLVGESNSALAPTMELINTQNQAIQENAKNGATFQFWAKLNNFAKDSDLAKQRRQFTRDNLRTGDGGMLLFPYQYDDIHQVEQKPWVASAEQMAQIDRNVFNYFGVNEKILQNSAYGDEWSAFYEGAIEPFAIQLSEVLTKMLFTERERAQGAQIMATANRLQYMSVRDKINFCREMGDRGYILIDEGRQVFNMAPLPDGAGQKAPIRGEYYFVGGRPKKGAEDDEIDGQAEE